MEDKKFYFTYGSEGHPFCGGWTEVQAHDIKEACQMFRNFHPDKHKGLLNCSSVYTEEQFAATRMFTGGNLDYCCHEIILWESSSSLTAKRVA